MPAAIRSALDVAAWFDQRAARDGARLAPVRLQRLLYFAQGFYAARHDGRRLMPAVFVAGELGPIEPNLYLILENGLPEIPAVTPTDEVAAFLEDVWHYLGAKSIEDLDRQLAADSAYVAAANRGKNAEITLREMALACRRLGSGAARPGGAGEAAPPADQEVRFTADGRSVTKWVPKRRVDGPTIKLASKRKV